MTAPNTLSRKYLATIGIVAVLILGLGLVIRIAINGRDTAPATTPAESFSLGWIGGRADTRDDRPDSRVEDTYV